jgi:hypothetical protein
MQKHACVGLPQEGVECGAFSCTLSYPLSYPCVAASPHVCPICAARNLTTHTFLWLGGCVFLSRRKTQSAVLCITPVSSFMSSSLSRLRLDLSSSEDLGVDQRRFRIDALPVGPAYNPTFHMPPAPDRPKPLRCLSAAQLYVGAVCAFSCKHLRLLFWFRRIDWQLMGCRKPTQGRAGGLLHVLRR